MIAVRDPHGVHPFIVGNDAGYFCLQCSTIVLDHTAFTQCAQSVLDREDQAQFVVLGLVDLEAIPEEKSSVPLGDDDNPIPLVKFTNIAQGQKTSRGRAGMRKKRERLKRKKRR